MERLCVPLLITRHFKFLHIKEPVMPEEQLFPRKLPHADEQTVQQPFSQSEDASHRVFLEVYIYIYSELSIVGQGYV